MTAATSAPGPATGLPAILPTHTCFDDVCDYFCLLPPSLLEQVHERFRIVHGVCLGHATGTPYAHAWIEEDHPSLLGSLAWQRGTLRSTGEAVYFALARKHFEAIYNVQVDRLTRYTVDQAAELIGEHGHLGPWREEYRALCNDTPGGRVLGSVSGVSPLRIMRVALMETMRDADYRARAQR